jgi:hypothetical protein
VIGFEESGRRRRDQSLLKRYLGGEKLRGQGVRCGAAKVMTD